jgi:uncharacterized membrane protein
MQQMSIGRMYAKLLVVNQMNTLCITVCQLVSILVSFTFILYKQTLAFKGQTERTLR